VYSFIYELIWLMIYLLPFVLVIWNLILTILVCKLYSKKKTEVRCVKCGSVQIAAVKQSANEGNGIMNICQNCGNTWEISR